MPRFPVGANNPFKTKGPETYFETEIWSCCQPWEIVVATYTWNNKTDAWRREQQFVRKCGKCGETPRPRMEDRLR